MTKLVLCFWLLVIVLLLVSLWTEAAILKLFGEDSWGTLGGAYGSMWVVPVWPISVVSFLFLIFLIVWMRKKEEHQSHPLMFTAFWFVSLFALVLWCWSKNMIWTYGGETFSVNWAVYIIPVLVGVTLLILLVDVLSRGWLLKQVGFFLSWGYPTIGKSLRSLSDWYDEAKAVHLAEEIGQKAGLPANVLLEKHPFARWMIAEITLNYENNVYAMAYWGAAILIVLIGFRGVKIIPKDQPTLVLVGLWLEMTVLFLLGMVLFYKPEETRERARQQREIRDEQLQNLKEEIMKELKEERLQDLKNEIIVELKERVNDDIAQVVETSFKKRG
jgi:hypothetical protein